MIFKEYLTKKTAVVALLATLIIGLTAVSISDDSENQKVTVLTGNERVDVSVEISDSESERRKGLMYRENLDLKNGMLFVFPDQNQRSFWMKNTYIPLDIVFIDSTGRILNIEEAYPEPNTSESELKRYSSEGEAKYVLELNSSFSETFSLKAGDRIKLYNAAK